MKPKKTLNLTTNNTELTKVNFLTHFEHTAHYIKKVLALENLGFGLHRAIGGENVSFKYVPKVIC